MQLKTILSLGACLLAFALPSQAANALKKEQRAARRAERKEAQRERLQTLGSFDTNGDGQIDGAERDAFRKAFADFKALDKNNDGILDDSEIETVKVPKGRKGASPGNGKKRKGGKKKQNESPAATS